jgi:hypothetical protein
MRTLIRPPAVLLCLLGSLVGFPVAAVQPFATYHEAFYPEGVGDFLVQEAWFGRAADLDADGRDELITGRDELGTGRSILTIRRFGAGLWDPTSTSSYVVGRAGLTPGLCEVANLDGDGWLDVVAPVYDTLAILPGTGPGTFGAPVYVRIPQIGAVALADFDADGTGDLAVTIPASDRVEIWRGTGSFGYGFLGQYATHNRPLQISVVDLDGNTAPDLIVGADTVSAAFLGDGAGGFTVLDVLGNHAEPAGDLNGDGHDDLLTASTSLLGAGDGTFQSLPNLPALQFCKAADLDEDGRPDRIGKRVMTPASMVSVQRGLGDGQFGLPSEPAWWASQPTTFAIGDFDGDGHLDLALPGRNVEPDAIYFGRGNGTFFAPRQIALTSPPLHVAAGSLGGDSRPDLVVTSRAANSMSVLLSNGLGSWAPADTLVLPGTPAGRRIAVADLNHDGRDDIVVGYSNLASVSVWLTQPNGLPGPRTDLVVPATSMVDLQVADLDQDQVPDILWLQQPAVFTGSPIQWFRGLGGGAFAAAQALTVNAAQCFVVGDLSGDGVPDIAFPGYNVNTTAILVTIASSPGVFPAPTAYDWLSHDPPLPERQIVVGDFDGNSHPDLALQSDRGIVRLHGLGGGSFAAPTGIGSAATGGFSSYCEPRDVDGDGVDDLVSGLPQPSRLRLLRFGSGGALISASILGISSGGTSTTTHAFADVDDNGTPDLVSAAARRPWLDLLLNRTPPEVLGVRPTVLGSGGLALAPVADPARGALTFRLSTALGASVRVELLDLQGRRVRSTVVRPNPGATTTVTFGPTTSVPAGAYFARARQGAAQAVTRTTVVH